LPGVEILRSACYSRGMTARTQAHILVADDDPVSLHFLASVLRELGCSVATAINGNTTLAACAERKFDLLLLDRRMPGKGGALLLLELRRRGCTDDAVATSAELDATMREELRLAGFLEALTKPIGIDQLNALLTRRVDGWQQRTDIVAAMRTSQLPASVLFEDQDALATLGGDAATLYALRGLLVTELAALVPQMLSSQPPMTAQALRESLHRLRAACRYCGAISLGASTALLESQLAGAGESIQVDLLPFLEICARTTALLNGRH
jgi:two-component system, OmpR family, response regulator